MSNPETDALREAIDNGAATEAEMTSLAGKLERERDEARKAVALIAEDCEAWLRSESDEPSAEFIKLVAKYARNHLTTPAQ